LSRERIEIRETDPTYWLNKVRNMNTIQKQQFEAGRKMGLTVCESMMFAGVADEIVNKIVAAPVEVRESIEDRFIERSSQERIAPEDKPVEFGQRSDVRQAASAAYFRQLDQMGKK
jgi:hypothetical protein